MPVTVRSTMESAFTLSMYSLLIKSTSLLSLLFGLLAKNPLPVKLSIDPNITPNARVEETRIGKYLSLIFIRIIINRRYASLQCQLFLKTEALHRRDNHFDKPPFLCLTDELI